MVFVPETIILKSWGILGCVHYMKTLLLSYHKHLRLFFIFFIIRGDPSDFWRAQTLLAVFRKIKIEEEKKQFWNQQVKCNHNPPSSTFNPTCDTNEIALRVAWVWSTWKPSEEPFSFLVGLYTVYLGRVNYSPVQYI